MRLTMPMRFITSTAFSPSAWKAGSFASRWMGPKPCLPPRSWTPFRTGDDAARAQGCQAVLASRELDAMAEGAETRGDPVAMVALDLHGALLDGASGPAQALELGRARFELAGRQAAKHGHDLAVAPAALAKDSHHGVLRHARRGRRGRTPRLGLAQTSLVRGVDGPAVLHGSSVARRRILLGTSRERGDAVAIAQAPPTAVQK